MSQHLSIATLLRIAVCIGFPVVASVGCSEKAAGPPSEPEAMVVTEGGESAVRNAAPVGSVHPSCTHSVAEGERITSAGDIETRRDTSARSRRVRCAVWVT